jgi:methionine-rich copper-binding protein CopC
MRKYIGNLAAIAVAIGLVAGGALPALAHAVIVSASPTADQHVAAGKLAVRIEFNARIDKERSRLQVMAPAGDKADVPIDQAGEPNVVAGTTPDLTPGAYVLRWQVLAIDGHITRGDIPFVVGN